MAVGAAGGLHLFDSIHLLVRLVRLVLLVLALHLQQSQSTVIVGGSAKAAVRVVVSHALECGWGVFRCSDLNIGCLDTI